MRTVLIQHIAVLTSRVSIPVYVSMEVNYSKTSVIIILNACQGVVRQASVLTSWSATKSVAIITSALTHTTHVVLRDTAQPL